MEGSSSTNSVLSFPKDIPVNIINCQEVFSCERSMAGEDKFFNLVIEQPIDFVSLSQNGFDVEKLFNNQYGGFQYMRFLNGPVYPTLVKDFWERCKFIIVEDFDKQLAE
jgi:hypothetical protein